MSHDHILIVDFGSQVTQLIARRVRDALNVALQGCKRARRRAESVELTNRAPIEHAVSEERASWAIEEAGGRALVAKDEIPTVLVGERLARVTAALSSNSFESEALKTTHASS